MQHHPVVSREEWLAARKALLAKEKEATHLRDKVNAERLALPWVKVEKDYAFDTPAGKQALADLFRRPQPAHRLSFHAGPGLGGGLPGLLLPGRPSRRRAAASRASRCDVDRGVARAAGRDRGLQARMGWRFPWVSSFGSDFNFDYHVSFTQGGARERHGLLQFQRDRRAARAGMTSCRA